MNAKAWVRVPLITQKIKDMKEDILKLRNEGKTYNEIQEILGCSKGTISYHCGEGQKEKTNKRSAKQRTNMFSY